MKRMSKEKYELIKAYRAFVRKHQPLPPEKEHRQKGAYKRKKYRLNQLTDETD
jgi:hypothetical protein